MSGVSKYGRRKIPQRLPPKYEGPPAACEAYKQDPLWSAAETEFMLAMEAYKTASGRRFPTCSEILGVLLGLGYARPAREVCTACVPETAREIEIGAAVEIAAERDAAAEVGPPDLTRKYPKGVQQRKANWENGDAT